MQTGNWWEGTCGSWPRVGEHNIERRCVEAVRVCVHVGEVVVVGGESVVVGRMQAGCTGRLTVRTRS